MTRMTRRLGAGLGLALLLSACGGPTDEPAGQDPGSPTSPTEEPTDAPTDEPAEVPETTPEAAAAADWLTTQLDDGVVRNEQFDIDDLGLSIDVALALDEIGGQDESVAAVTDAVRTDQASYTTLGDDVYAGATAKALVLLQSQGADVGDLPDQLEGLVSAEGPATGRLSDRADDDFATVIGQAFGARALLDAESEDAADVASYLLDQQCTDGWFRASFASPRAEDETCDGDPGATADNDTTALALLVVGPVADQVEGGEAAMDEAAAWLVSEQDADGALVGAEGPTPNANTTGLAGWALGRWGETDAAAASAAAVQALQSTDGTDAGAVAYDAPSQGIFDRDGIGVPQQDQVRRATAQAAPALLWLTG